MKAALNVAWSGWSRVVQVGRALGCLVFLGENGESDVNESMVWFSWVRMGSLM